MPTHWKAVLTIAICLSIFTTSPALPTAEQDKPTVYLLAIPGKSWALNIPTWAFTEGDSRVEGGTTSFIGARAGDKKQKLSPVMLNIQMGPAKAPGDAQALSEFAKKNLRKKSVVVPDSIKQTVYNSIPINRYSIDINPTFSPQTTGFPKGKIFEAYYVKDDIWITVQLNFLEFRKEDEKFFFSLLDSLRIEDVRK